MKLKTLTESFDNYINKEAIDFTTLAKGKEKLEYDTMGRGKLFRQVIAGELKEYLKSDINVITYGGDNEALKFRIQYNNNQFVCIVYLFSGNGIWMNVDSNKANASSDKVRNNSKISSGSEHDTISDDETCKNFNVEKFSDIPKSSIMAEFKADLTACLQNAFNKGLIK